MAHRVNFRRTLLAAVDAFLEGAPSSLERGHRLVKRCYDARQFTTLDEVVWGGIISELTDSVFYEHLPALRKHRVVLAHGSSEVHCAYVNHNFRDGFTPVERDWYAQFWGVLDFFDTSPFANATEVIAEYEWRSSAIKSLAEQSPPPSRLGDEMIYHFVMREVTEITTNICLRPVLLEQGRMIPGVEYSAFPPRPQTHNWLDQAPDPRESLEWARKALRSIVEDGWMLITWQVTRHHYNLSLH